MHLGLCNLGGYLVDRKTLEGLPEFLNPDQSGLMLGLDADDVVVLCEHHSIPAVKLRTGEWKIRKAQTLKAASTGRGISMAGLAAWESIGENGGE